MTVGLMSLWGTTLMASAFLHKTAVKVWLWFLSIAGTLATVALSETVRQGVGAAFN
jgi:hypothetical protein